MSFSKTIGVVYELEELGLGAFPLQKRSRRRRRKIVFRTSTPAVHFSEQIYKEGQRNADRELIQIRLCYGIGFNRYAWLAS